MAGDKCSQCDKVAKDWKLCKCPQTCKICLRYKMLGDNGSCSGCECGNSHNQCSCLRNSSSTPSISAESSSQASNNGHLRPPDMGQLKKKENLETYITALLRWARLTETKKKDQADIVLHWAHSQYPELAIQLDA